MFTGSANRRRISNCAHGGTVYFLYTWVNPTALPVSLYFVNPVPGIVPVTVIVQVPPAVNAVFEATARVICWSTVARPGSIRVIQPARVAGPQALLPQAAV